MKTLLAALLMLCTSAAHSALVHLEPSIGVFGINTTESLAILYSDGTQQDITSIPVAPGVILGSAEVLIDLPFEIVEAATGGPVTPLTESVNGNLIQVDFLSLATVFVAGAEIAPDVVVPIPAPLVLLGSGLIALFSVARRR